jgi:hypothetical protein
VEGTACAKALRQDRRNMEEAGGLCGCSRVTKGEVEETEPGDGFWMKEQ